MYIRRGDPCEVTAAHGEIWEPGLPRQPAHGAIPRHPPSLCQHVPQAVTPSFGFLCFVPCHHSVSSQKTGWLESVLPTCPSSPCWRSHSFVYGSSYSPTGSHFMDGKTNARWRRKSVSMATQETLVLPAPRGPSLSHTPSSHMQGCG